MQKCPVQRPSAFTSTCAMGIQVCLRPSQRPSSSSSSLLFKEPVHYEITGLSMEHLGHVSEKTTSSGQPPLDSHCWSNCALDGDLWLSRLPHTSSCAQSSNFLTSGRHWRARFNWQAQGQLNYRHLLHLLDHCQWGSDLEGGGAGSPAECHQPSLTQTYTLNYSLHSPPADSNIKQSTDFINTLWDQIKRTSFFLFSSGPQLTPDFSSTEVRPVFKVRHENWKTAANTKRRGRRSFQWQNNGSPSQRDLVIGHKRCQRWLIREVKDKCGFIGTLDWRPTMSTHEHHLHWCLWSLLILFLWMNTVSWQKTGMFEFSSFKRCQFLSPASSFVCQTVSKDLRFKDSIVSSINSINQPNSSAIIKRNKNVAFICDNAIFTILASHLLTHACTRTHAHAHAHAHGH